MSCFDEMVKGLHDNADVPAPIMDKFQNMLETLPEHEEHIEKNIYKWKRIVVAAVLFLIFAVSGTVHALHTNIVKDIISEYMGNDVPDNLTSQIKLMDYAMDIAVETSAPESLVQFKLLKAIKNEKQVNIVLLATIDENVLATDEKGYDLLKFDPLNEYDDDNVVNRRYLFLSAKDASVLSENQAFIYYVGYYDEDISDIDEICLGFAQEDNDYFWNITVPITSVLDKITYHVELHEQIYGMNMQSLTIAVFADSITLHGEGLSGNILYNNDKNYLLFADGTKVLFDDIMMGEYLEYSDSDHDGYAVFNFMALLDIDEIVGLELDGVRIEFTQ